MIAPSPIFRALRLGALLLCTGWSGVAASSAAELSWEAEIESSYVGKADASGGDRGGSFDAFEVGTRNVASIQIPQGPLARIGFEVNHIGLGSSGRSDIPTALEKTVLVLGADFQVGEAWLFRLEVEPGFYSNDWTFDADTFNAPIIFGGSYFVSADLQFVGGVSMDFRRKYPVLPGVGLRWKMSKDWVANFVFPSPRVEYSLTKPVTLYVGADFRGDTYRIDGELGDRSGKYELDNAVVDYSQIRVGAGVAWKVNNTVSFEVEGGWAAVHELDFHRADTRIRADEAPGYGSISLRAAF